MRQKPSSIQQIKTAAQADPQHAFTRAGFAGLLQREGNHLVGLCPFHSDSTPSFKIAIEGQYAGRFKCFGCKANGTIIDFYLRRNKLENLTAEVVEDLGRMLGVGVNDSGGERGKKDRERETGRQVYPIFDAEGSPVAEHVRIEFVNEESQAGKRFEWWRDGKPGLHGLKTADLSFYRLPDLLEAPPGQLVIVVEGEKACDALAEHGFLAVGTVTGAGNPIPGHAALEFLRPYRVALWPDADPEGADHMNEIGARLAGMGIPARGIAWEDPRPKGDAADFFAGGGTAEDMQGLLASAHEWQPPSPAIGALQGSTGEAASARLAQRTSWTAADLLTAEFEPTRWAVEDVIPEGLTVLAGRPKRGKSVLSLQIAGAVSSGGSLFGVNTEKGTALYLCLEDNKKRLQGRMRNQGWPTDANCEIELSWPVFDKGGMRALARRLRERQYRLVVIDTLARFLGGGKDFNDYAVMSAALAELQRLALETGTPILVVTHTTKIGTGDEGSKILGSTAIAGVADGFMVLEQTGGGRGWTLCLEGRDIDQFEVSIKRDPVTLTWQLAQGADGIRVDSLQAKVLEAIDAAGGSASCKEVADALGKDKALVHRELRALVRKGLLVTGERQGREIPYRRVLPM